jgi:hypothetical protein
MPPDDYSISQVPGVACPGGPSATPPGFAAGTVTHLAGPTSPFVLNLSRERGSPEIGSIDLTTPPGPSASFAGVGTLRRGRACRGLAALPREQPGRRHRRRRRVPSRFGWAATSTGPVPTTARRSLLAAIPTRVGPFDLGPVLLRIAVFVDPATAQLRLLSEPLPRILSGVPVDLHSLDISLDRPGFIRNPTSEMTVSGSIASPGRRAKRGPQPSTGQRMRRAELQAQNLPPPPREPGPQWPPGAARRPTRKAGEAGIAAASFTLWPRELFSISTTCAPSAPANWPPICPAGSELGSARLWSPALDGPLRGPVYLRKPAPRLPDLLADLRGVHLLLHGHTAAPGRRLGPASALSRTSRSAEPVFTLDGGHRGIFANNEALRERPRRVKVTMGAQDGKRRGLRPCLLGPSC